MTQTFNNAGPIYTTSAKYEAMRVAGTLENGREYKIVDWEAQEKLTAGDNITIVSGVISAANTTYTAGNNINITENIISATDTKYTAGDNVTITGNVISATDTVYTAGNGIEIENNVISIDGISGIAIYDNRVDDADEWLTNGYTKTHSTSEEYEAPTLNLPAVCIAEDRWGVLLYVAENNENHAGLQQYFPIDGTYKGRIFFRSVTGYGPGIDPDFGEWNIVPWSDEKENKGKVTIGNTEYGVRTSTTDAGESGYITFVVSA